jgi:hypothetical protein
VEGRNGMIDRSMIDRIPAAALLSAAAALPGFKP